MRLMDDPSRKTLFGLLDEPLAAEALAESDPLTTVAIAENLGPRKLSGLVQEMAPDDAADVLSELEGEEAGRILDLMEREEAREVQELMAHAEDSGGGIMTPELIFVRQDTTVSHVIETLRREVGETEVLELYVVDGENRLVGKVPLHRLVTGRPESTLSGLMVKDLITVSPETDQEEIAKLFTRYDLFSLPVVGPDGTLIGQITVDDVLDVIHDEATEDIYKMAGTSEQEIAHASVLGVVWVRLPWRRRPLSRRRMISSDCLSTWDWPRS